MATSHMTRLIKRDKGLCHYCKRQTNRTPGSALQATKEHVVPRSMGGANSTANYVLACAGCNNKRATTLFYCKCDHCTFLIRAALLDQTFIDKVFEGIIKHNRPVVYAADGMWAVRKGHVRRHFDTWSEAMDYAHNGTFRKGE